MEVFNDEESLELLSWNAFRNHRVAPRYKDVLNRAITYAQGLPLALEVIGSKLCGKNISEWESALDPYKSSLYEGIEQVLRVSYEDLGKVEKEIFLDIAFAFNGKELEYVKYMVEAVHDAPNLSYSIRVLEDKSLIKIEKHSECIEMHDLVRDMGRKIVLEESSNNPGERSRLWFHQDIVDVLERNTGTNKVRMIVLNNWGKRIEVNWDGEAFRSMKELKILIFENVKFSEDPKYLPESLKVLRWRRCLSLCLPPNFNPKKLVVLDLGYRCLCSSSLKTIMKNSYNLGIFNLNGCEYVKEIPDLSNLKSLKELRLRHCQNLIGINDSIGYLPKLKILEVYVCGRLKTFPRAIKLPSLEKLNLFGCSSLKHFPEILGKMKMRDLYIKQTGIKELPWSICNLSELKSLEILLRFDSVIEIPNSIFLFPNTERIFVENNGEVTISCEISCESEEAQEEAIWSQQCPNRVQLHLERCNISDDVIRTYLSRFMNVSYLDLEGNDFTILPAWIKECHFLETLILNDCKHLREVEGIPPNIRQLEAKNCVSLSLESKSLLLSEELHGAPGRYNNKEYCYFWVPRESIPNWFHHRSKGASISFWFRHSFPPALCFCVLLKPNAWCRSWLYIDKKQTSHLGLITMGLRLDFDHLGVYYLKEDHILSFEGERLLLEDRWYHAQFCVESEAGVVKEIGMYVIKELCDMESITFTNPNHQDASADEDDGVVDTNSNNDNNEQVGTRMEEKEAAVNKKRRLMGDDNFTSDDNDATPQVPFVKAHEIITNNQVCDGPVDQAQFWGKTYNRKGKSKLPSPMQN